MEISKVDLVKNYIFNEVKSGKIKAGQRLPSCREISSKLGVNKITANKAYNELEDEHRVYSIPRGGFYLVDSAQNSRDTEDDLVDFCTVKPDEKLIPYREFAHVMNNAVDLYKGELFGYEHEGGLSSLRNTLKTEFEKDGVYTSSQQMIITHGAQQALWLVLQSAFRTRNGKLLVESPTYSLVLDMARQLGVEAVGIEKKVDGFDYNAMEKIFRTGEIVCFYIIPRHHNPTGYSLSENDKLKIVKLSKKYEVLVIEDDYLADLGSAKGFMPIHYYDTTKSSVYIKSFSKTFMPGIRTGVAVLPKSIYEDVLNLKHVSDLNTSLIPQAALDLFIKSGMYEKHIKKVRKSYEAKLRICDAIFKTSSCEDVSFHVPHHGIFLWLSLPFGVRGEELENNLRHKGILIKTATNCYPSNCFQGNDSVRLCISGVMEERLNSLRTVIMEINNLRNKYSAKNHK
ncbi:MULTISPECIES: aminotransferase-like domain-containing protein [unclassified Sedimentibacter]|uniref:aminotransferase-like domain-containing protein n=1 Tax=unclassified Sedimentibacter TaxID=2649220 RepID=UPI0027E01794|nr:PLP-dependent aminotransferase family protein [Sedimentibacter sp. MB35-C1]WMJ77501.1 PLP-dependent aminotransferase family protein [Sedimentibacter sp. MB35-C1]